MLAFEDDGAGLSTVQLNEAMDVAPDESEGLPLISYNGEGMKMAAISLVQEEGFVYIFSKQAEVWTVVMLDMGDRRQVQINSLALPADMVQPADDRSLSIWYKDQGYADPYKILQRLCKLPERRSALRVNGHIRSPFNELSDLHEVIYLRAA